MHLKTIQEAHAYQLSSSLFLHFDRAANKKMRLYFNKTSFKFSLSSRNLFHLSRFFRGSSLLELQDHIVAAPLLSVGANGGHHLHNTNGILSYSKVQRYIWRFLLLSHSKLFFMWAVHKQGNFIHYFLRCVNTVSKSRSWAPISCRSCFAPTTFSWCRGRKGGLEWIREVEQKQKKNIYCLSCGECIGKEL